MKLMVISLFLIPLTILSTSALEINAPESIEINEEFSVEITSDESEIQDVKIFVHNSIDDKVTRGEYISEIKNQNKWQDSWNYLLASYPNKSIYEIRVIESPGEREICVRLRKGTTTSAPICNSITVTSEAVENINTKEKIKDEVTEEEGVIESEVEEIIEEENKLEEKTPLSTTSKSTPLHNQERLILNPKSQEEEPPELIFQTKKSKFRNSMFYAFLGLCVTIIILLALKRL